MSIRGLEIRLAYTRDKLAHTIDPSQEFVCEWMIHAERQGLADYEAGRRNPPALFVDVPELLSHWEDGQAQGQEDARYAEYLAEPHPVWFGEWSMDLDGTTEVRAVVFQSKDGFHAGREVSHRGGDCGSPSYGEPLPTEEEAIQAAEELVEEWHQQD